MSSRSDTPPPGVAGSSCRCTEGPVDITALESIPRETSPTDGFAAISAQSLSGPETLKGKPHADIALSRQHRNRGIVIQSMIDRPDSFPPSFPTCPRGERMFPEFVPRSVPRGTFLVTPPARYPYKLRRSAIMMGTFNLHSESQATVVHSMNLNGPAIFDIGKLPIDWSELALLERYSKDLERSRKISKDLEGFERS